MSAETRAYNCSPREDATHAALNDIRIVFSATCEQNRRNLVSRGDGAPLLPSFIL